ncbi:hypothetical protein [Nonomuraea endophytica]|uniref:hypothetical protein n=1 Tax=Nonomuraea endophytica TaxID=714136 RepID=UPI0037C664E7
MDVDLDKVISHLRQRQAAMVEQLTYENAILAGAVEMLQSEAERLTEELTEARRKEPDA